MSYVYTVRATIEDRRLFAAFVTWMATTHMADVASACGGHGELVTFEGAQEQGPRTVEARYWLRSAEAYARYEREAAPGLREVAMAELARMAAGGAVAVTFDRTHGPVVAQR